MRWAAPWHRVEPLVVGQLVRCLSERSARAVALAVTLTGCAPSALESRPTPGTPAASPPAVSVSHVVDAEARAAATCRERADDLRAWLGEVEALGWPLAPALLDDGARLIVRSGVMLDEPAPIVHVTAAELLFDGFRVADAALLGERLTQWVELRRRTLEPSPFLANARIYVAVDGDVRWDRLVAVLERVAAAGLERVAFVFVSPERPNLALGPSAIDEDLARLAVAAPSRRPQLLAEELAFVHKDCPSVLHLVAQLGHDVPEVNEALVEQLPAALEACRCQADLSSVKSVHWALFGNPRPGTAVTLALAATGTPPARLVRAPADAAWLDAHELVVTVAAKNPASVAFQAEVLSEPETPKGSGRSSPRRGSAR